MSKYEISNYDQLDDEINQQLQMHFSDLENLEIERKKIGDKKKLAESISQIVWEQFMIQIAGTAGNQFIKENNNLNLSLKKADHFLDENNFIKGELPSHNANLSNYQERYNKWDSNFESGSNHSNLAKGYRTDFDANRAKGSASMAMDHTIPVAEILRDEKGATYLDHQEKIDFANDTNVNLKPLDSAANQSKSDKNMTEWLNSKRDGKTPEERFNIDGKELRERDINARKEYQSKLNEAKERAIQEGKESRRAEIVKSAKITQQAVAVALLAKLTRTIFQELIVWLSEKNKSAKSFIEHVKKAIVDFIYDFKRNMLLAVDVASTVILLQIIGPIVTTIKKALLLLKAGGKTLLEVIQYLKNPTNKNKETSVMVLEIGKIVTIGLTTVGGVALSGTLSTALSLHIPSFNTPIPLLGTPANLIGIFLGGLTSGVCGAIVLNLIDGALENRKIYENTAKQINVKNDILELQNKQFINTVKKVESVKSQAADSIINTNKEAVKKMQEMKDSLNEKRESQNKSKFDEIDDLLNFMN